VIRCFPRVAYRVGSPVPADRLSHVDRDGLAALRTCSVVGKGVAPRPLGRGALPSLFPVSVVLLPVLAGVLSAVERLGGEC